VIIDNESLPQIALRKAGNNNNHNNAKKPKKKKKKSFNNLFDSGFVQSTRLFEIFV